MVRYSARGRSVPVDGHAMLVDLDVDPALAFLLVEIACPNGADSEHDDQDERIFLLIDMLLAGPWTLRTKWDN